MILTETTLGVHIYVDDNPAGVGKQRQFNFLACLADMPTCHLQL
jgi:hypothetical protein